LRKPIAAWVTFGAVKRAFLVEVIKSRPTGLSGSNVRVVFFHLARYFFQSAPFMQTQSQSAFRWRFADAG
jgi:hypothetical protein